MRTSSRGHRIRLLPVLCAAAFAICIGHSQTAYGGHGDSPSALSAERDNNQQDWNRLDLTAAGIVACDWGAAHLDNNSEIVMSGPGQPDDIHCRDNPLNEPWFGLTTCTTLTAQGRCDHYKVIFDLSDYGQIDSTWEREEYEYIGCHEFGHTSSIGHRTNTNSCMVSGDHRRFYDAHDHEAIENDYP